MQRKQRIMPPGSGRSDQGEAVLPGAHHPNRCLCGRAGQGMRPACSAGSARADAPGGSRPDSRGSTTARASRSSLSRRRSCRASAWFRRAAGVRTEQCGRSAAAPARRDGRTGAAARLLPGRNQSAGAAGARRPACRDPARITCRDAARRAASTGAPIAGRTRPPPVRSDSARSGAAAGSCRRGFRCRSGRRCNA